MKTNVTLHIVVTVSEVHRVSTSVLRTEVVENINKLNFQKQPHITFAVKQKRSYEPIYLSSVCDNCYLLTLEF